MGLPGIKGGPLRRSNPAYHYWRPIADGRAASRPRRPGGGRGGSWRPLPPLPPVAAFAGKRQNLIRHGGKAWLDEDGHSRIAVESRMGHEVAGVEGLYTMVTVAMERAIMASLQARWERFLAALGHDWMSASPIPLPRDLAEWMNAQVAAAKERCSSSGA
ncbi:hypothetical protein [Streptomyces chrestomyceticus]|uniref:hypothetical protein n=1 Tax=Streptomyces chrestomyceticus TaxID=68185 RepID=UPI0033EE2DC3